MSETLEIFAHDGDWFTDAGTATVYDDHTVDYTYDGPDPNNVVVPFLDKVANGTYEFEYDGEITGDTDEPYPTEKQAEMIAGILCGFSPIREVYVNGQW